MSALLAMESTPLDGDGDERTSMDVTVDEIRALMVRLGRAVPADLSNAQRVALIRAAEDAQAAFAGLQAVLTTDLDAATRAEQAAAGVPARRQGAGVATQVGLARRSSHAKATRQLGLAKLLSAEMPHTLAALRAGRLSEWRATLIARETACLTVENRRVVDAELCADPGRLAGWGDRQVVDEARTLAYRLDPQAVVNRAAHAVNDRYVSCKPAPDTMTWVTALLPVVDGVAVKATLKRRADAIRAGGDPRTQGQLEADTLVALITGRPASTVPAGVVADEAPDEDARAGTSCTTANGPTPDGGTKLVLNVVMSDAAVFGLADEPAVVSGYGTVPAPWARNRVAEILDRVEVDPDTEAWIRRLYVAPETGALVAMDSKARLIRGGLRDAIQLRDQRCRIPYCDAPIAHVDHLDRHADGGDTSEENSAGVCAAHNYDREAPGHRHVPSRRRGRRRRRDLHAFTIITASGHRYTSTAPGLPVTPP